MNPAAVRKLHSGTPVRQKEILVGILTALVLAQHREFLLSLMLPPTPSY